MAQLLITETWWVDSPSWSAAMDVHKFFRRDRLGKRISGVALCVRVCFDCLDFNDGDDWVECLWVRTRGKVNMTEVMQGLCCRLLKQDEEQVKYSIGSWKKSHNH